MLIDTHAHVNFNAYKEDGQEVIKRALDKNIWLINVGAEYKTSQRAVEYAQKYSEGVYASVGLHPIHLEDQVIQETIEGKEVDIRTKKEDFDWQKYFELAQDDKVVAIGEVGLDYKEASDKDLQKRIFMLQVELAQQIGKPLIIHCRDAYDDLLDILNEFQGHCAGCPMGCGGGQIKGVVHCFCGNSKEARKFLDLGLYLGFNGMITFSDKYDQIIKEVPLERILTETDCPFLTPQPHRGKRNEPAYVQLVAEKIAQTKGLDFEEVAEVTTQNAKSLFCL